MARKGIRGMVETKHGFGAKALVDEFGGTFIESDGRGDGSMASSEFTPEVIEEQERVSECDPLRHRGTVILKVRSSREGRICEKMGFLRGTARDGYGRPTYTDDPRSRHIPAAGRMWHSEETGHQPLGGQSFAFFARGARL